MTWERVTEVTLEPQEPPIIPFHPARVVNIRPPSLDGMKREILVGDILTWKSGGYFHSYQSYGLVLRVNDQSMRVRRHSGHETTIWIFSNTVIVARYPHYELIPEEILEKLGIENF